MTGRIEWRVWCWWLVGCRMHISVLFVVVSLAGVGQRRTTERILHLIRSLAILISFLWPVVFHRSTSIIILILRRNPIFFSRAPRRRTPKDPFISARMSLPRTTPESMKMVSTATLKRILLPWSRNQWPRSFNYRHGSPMVNPFLMNY